MQSVICISNNFKCLYNFNHKMESVTARSLQMEMFLFKAFKWNLSFFFPKLSCWLVWKLAIHWDKVVQSWLLLNLHFFFPRGERFREENTAFYVLHHRELHPPPMFTPIMWGTADLHFLTSLHTKVLRWRFPSFLLWTWDYSSDSFSQCIINMLFPGS